MAIGNPITLTNNIADKITSHTATADQTLFTVPGGYLVNKLSVYRNGVRLSQSEDYTANDGATITLVTPANLNDTIQFQTFDYFDVADAITSEGGTVFGDLTITGTITGNGTGLTGVASTDNIITGTAATFTGGINAAQSDVSVRNLTGVAATFTGVVSYEDVTSIDSIGIITARAGINVLAGGINAVGVVTATSAKIGTAVTITTNGIDATGVVTATSFRGDGSLLENLPASGDSAAKSSAIALFLGR